MKSTISVNKDVKELLERKKKEMEIKLNRPLTWDEFFQEVFKEESVPRLTEKEAEMLKKLVLEDRKNWKAREFA
ncbi:VapB-type antitoxin [Sulfolobus sp. E5-1-F]|uniref:VapB-type antitoxin n=1 Tax=Saccharolobus sp. E5-1-F TaxID=2663019 RepID=UPI001294C233|nr:VapB-type antitoxin [Sulfolobus sp. E5-1-F]QGA53785.1 VapB-type antitoxin [Sulfolobus sp. E5-1-F]